MLLRFQVANHRSISHRVEMSMIAIDDERAATRGFPLLSERVLTVAGIYGPNASGKSNLLDAVAWLSTAVANSLRSWGDFVPRDPHRFDANSDAKSSFDIDFVVEGIRYEYNLEVNGSAVLYESLHSYPRRRRRTLFEREGDTFHFRRGLTKANAIRELTAPTGLALSAAIRVGDPEIRIAGRALAGVRALGLKRRPDPRFFCSLHSPSARLFEHESPLGNNLATGAPPQSPWNRASAIELLRFADPAIDDVEIQNSSQSGRQSVGDLLFVHDAAGEPVAFPLEDESAGTQTWFHLLGPALGTLRKGQVLLVDEIDASLHPQLSARLIDLFRDPQTNPRGAQLIFSSHDTTLLDVLNRDEIWLTEKSSTNSTRLVALAEYKGDRVRKSVNLERAYLQGRFGALPEIDQADVRRVVGLTVGAS